MPNMPDSFVKTVSERYIELYEIITGKLFQKDHSENALNRINKNVEKYLMNI